MNKSKQYSSKECEQLIQKYHIYQSENNNPHAQAVLKCPGCSITIYKNYKVLFQGDNCDMYIPSKEHSIIEQAGSDEVGTGDFFGPVVVCACVILEKDIDFLQSLNIMDSKKMNDENILKVAPLLVQQLTHQILFLNNTTYNQWHESLNMNAIKAKLHNLAYLKLAQKINLPDLCVIDQFTPEKSYYTYLKSEKEVFRKLHFETKSEDRYIAVACASIIARYGFLLALETLREKYKFHFAKGAGVQVDQQIAQFIQIHGENALQEVAKVHFANMKKYQDYL